MGPAGGKQNRLLSLSLSIYVNVNFIYIYIYKFHIYIYISSLGVSVKVWKVLAPPGKRLHDLLRAKDIERSGTLAPSIFQDTLQERRLLLSCFFLCGVWRGDP